MQLHFRRHSKTTLRQPAFSVLFLLSLLVTVSGVSGASPLGITGEHQVTAQNIATANEIPLITLTPVDAPETVAFELKWEKDTAAWFPVWKLRLTSDLGLIAGNDPSGVELARISPTQGRTYAAVMSYSPELGVVALRIADTADDRVVYSGAVEVAEYLEPLRIAEGSSSHGYIPIGNTWSSGQVSAGGTFLPIYVFESRQTPAVVRVATPAPVPDDAAYRLYVESAGAETLVAEIIPEAAETYVDLPLAELPLGSSVLRLDYVQGDVLLLSDSLDIVLGRIDFWMTPVAQNREEGLLAATFTVRSPEPVAEPIQVKVDAFIEELVWDSEVRDFTLVPYGIGEAFNGTIDLSEGVTEVVVQVPLPEREGNWQVTFTPSMDPDVVAYVGGQERLFSTHNPARVEEGEAYTFVVFPDTQYFSARYPHIYTRMTDWVTAHAEDYNIVGLLHVGDITDNNTTGQWDVAFRSMSLLHDVVPYVLTIGNHDMVLNGVRRGVTRVNDYFPEDAARRYSNLGGTMVPGRIENSYALFSVAGDKYLVIALEFGPPNEAVEWAQQVASDHLDHKMILLTHSYTSRSGGRSLSPMNYAIAEDPNTTVNTSASLWEKLLRTQPNSFLVVSGHTSPDLPVVPYGFGRNAYGQSVYELLFDWQTQPNGGNGWLGMITFNPDGTLHVRVYSPYLDEWGNYRDGNGHTSELLIDPERSTVQRIW